MSALKVVLVGMGRMGTNWARVIQAGPHFRLAAIVDPVADGPKVRRSIADLKGVSYDAAIVATPTPTHHDVASDLLTKGKTVLVEKPMASTSFECMTLLGSAGRLVVGHVERFNPAIVALGKAIDQGLIGTPIHFSCTRVGGYPAHVTLGNNVTLDLAVHDLDLLRQLIGPLRVAGSVCHATVDKDVCDTAEILLSSPGASATVHVNWTTPIKIRTMRVTGTRGVAFVDLIAQTVEVVCDSSRLVCATVNMEPLAEQLSAFATFVRTGDRGLLCSPPDAMQAVLLAEEALHISNERARRAA